MNNYRYLVVHLTDRSHTDAVHRKGMSTDPSMFAAERWTAENNVVTTESVQRRSRNGL